MIQLKPCPLCCDPERTNMEVYFSENVLDLELYRAGCGSCGCSTPEFKTKEESANFWNFRIKDPNKNNCPMCNSIVKLSEYKVRPEQIEPFFRYSCDKCGFSGGVSKDKKLIVDSWSERGFQKK